MSPSRKTAFLVLALISVVSCATIYAFLQRRNALGSTIAIGVFSALIATGIATGLASILTVRPRTSPTRDDPPQRDRMVRLTPKSAVSSKEWLDVLTGAKHEFYIAGHSLGNWCSAEHRDLFTSSLARILRRGSVTLVILHPDSQQLTRLQQATGTDYSTRIHRSLQVLAHFVQELPAGRRSQLRISLLKDPLALPYMLVGNEHGLITATYLASRDSDEVPCLTLDRRTDAAAAIYNDFRDLATQGDPASL